MNDYILFTPPRAKQKSRVQPPEIFFLAGLILLNSLFVHWNAFRGLNFFDMGAFMDASWRILIGQKPYIDFQYISGILHLYVNAFFYFLFGFGKTAVWIHVATIHSFVILLTYYTGRLYLPIAPRVLATLLTTTCFYWTASHPWHDQTAHLWGIIAIALLVRALPFNNGQALKTSCAVGVLAACSYFTKTNVGAAYFGIFFLVLLTEPHWLKSLLSYFLGFAITVTILLLCIHSLEAYIDQVFFTWNIPVQRLRRSLPLLYIPTYFKDFYWLLMASGLIAIRSSWKKNISLVVLSLGIYAVAIFSMATGTMKQTANIPLMGMCSMIAFTLCYLPNSSYQESTRKKAISVISITSLVLIFISTNRGIRLDTWAYGPLNPIGNYEMQTKSIRGWMAKRESGEAVDALVEFINQNVPKNESLLVLTDLQILYPLTSRESYKGVPFIFTVGEEPPPGKRVNLVRNNILNNPPVWIVTHVNADSESFVSAIIPYLDLQEFIMNQYIPVFKKNNYLVLHRK